MTRSTENKNGIFIHEPTIHLGWRSIQFSGKGHHKIETTKYDMVFMGRGFRQETKERILSDRELLDGRINLGIKMTESLDFLSGVDLIKTPVFGVDDFDYIYGNDLALSTWIDVPISIAMLTSGWTINRRANKKAEQLPPTRRQFLKKIAKGLGLTGTVLAAQSTPAHGLLLQLFGDVPDTAQDYQNAKQRIIGSNYIDRRNAIIAAKANEIARVHREKSGTKPTCVMMYGIMHGDMLNYLKDPKLTKERLEEIQRTFDTSLGNYAIHLEGKDLTNDPPGFNARLIPVQIYN